MPYPQSTIRLVFGGKIDTDIWRTTLDLVADPTGPAITAANMNGVAASARALFLASVWTPVLQTANTSLVNFSQTNAYYYLSGTSAAAAVGEAVAVVGTGTGASNYLPLRNCIVASKRTLFAGTRNRGRMYLPVTVASLTAVGQQYLSTLCSAVANGVADLVSDLNAADWAPYGFDGQTCIVTSPSAVSAGSAITRITADSLPDTQRRRTNKDAPTYVQSADVV